MFSSLAAATQMALVAVARNKLRAALTVLGVLVGIAAVVATTALGEGARARIDDQISKLGPNVLIIWPQANQASGARATRGAGGRLTEADARALERDATSIGKVAPYLQGNVQVVYGDRNAAIGAFGTTRAFFDVRDWPVTKGELWGSSSELVGERICVMGTTTAKTLFGDVDPVGYRVRIGRHSFTVIGLLESKGQSPFGNDQDDVVVMPISTFRSHVTFAPNKIVHSIIFSATSAVTSDHAKDQAEAILRERHGIGEGRQADFVVRSQAELRASQDAIYGALSMLLLVVGAVSLLVGGIGIMNIMLVSVAERTKEIGIRMSLGAREGDILRQFLAEAIVLALAGGIAGTLLATGFVVVGTRFWDLSLKLDPRALAVALLTSTVIGLVFGFFPARRAARLDPIVALGRE